MNNPQQEKTQAKAPGFTLEEQVWEQLKLCYDPEIPVNIVDLGLVYGVNVQKIENEAKEQHAANIRMTLTTLGCSMGAFITEEVRYRVSSLPQINKVNIELTFDPPWDRSMMSTEAKLALGLI